MTRRDFRTPSTVPEGYITRCVTIPASQEWLGLVNAALLMLTEPWRYTQVFDTDLTPAETAAIAFDMYVAYLEGCEAAMDCSDVIACMLPYMQAQQIASGVVRLDPVTGDPQVSYDGGVTWSGVPQSPQPVQTPTPQPTPGADDAARICLAATRAALVIAEFYSQTFGAFTADLLNTLNGINQFLHSINTALYNLIYSPYEGILEAAGWFDFDFTTNYTAATLTTGQIEEITCLLIDNATIDGDGVVSFNHTAVQAALISVLGVNPGTAVTLNVSNMRSEGLKAASQVNVVSIADCAYCDPAWCYEFDFTADNGGFNAFLPACGGSNPIYSVWSSGVGWVNGEGIRRKDTCEQIWTWRRVLIRRAFTGTLTGVEIEYDYTAGGGFKTVQVLGVTGWETGETPLISGGSTTTGTGKVATWSGIPTYVDGFIEINIWASETLPAGSVTVKRMTLLGTGDNPIGVDNC